MVSLFFPSFLFYFKLTRLRVHSILNVCLHIGSNQGGTQITYDLSTVRPTSLFKLGEFVKCKSCAASTIALYMQSVLSIRFGRQPFGDSMGHKVKGIGQDRQHLQETRAATQECADSFVAYKWMEAAGQAWPFGPDHFAPVMIKSHYPMIGTGDARTISYFATKIIHLVRNPFDNLASRYVCCSFGSQPWLLSICTLEDQLLRDLLRCCVV